MERGGRQGKGKRNENSKPGGRKGARWEGGENTIVTEREGGGRTGGRVGGG